MQPSNHPTIQPSNHPTIQPSNHPTIQPVPTSPNGTTRCRHGRKPVDARQPTPPKAPKG
uniref:PT domain-containing protein n=1 Tax=Rhodopirellula islandica TaxID=595434 RepID=UPI0036F358B3